MLLFQNAQHEPAPAAMEHFFLNAFIQHRRVNDGVRVTLKLTCNKFTSGARTHKAHFVNIGDIDHWVARIVVETCSDVQGLTLRAALRALEVRHCCLKNITWELLRGCGYSVGMDNKPYYNSSVYTAVRVFDLIAVNKET